jgi:hypothetical protein
MPSTVAAMVPASSTGIRVDRIIRDNLDPYVREAAHAPHHSYR